MNQADIIHMDLARKEKRRASVRAGAEKQQIPFFLKQIHHERK